jgi:hydrogenase 3 maturation protease
MKAELREQLRCCLRGRVCFVGVGNVERGDDGFGVRLAEELDRAGVRDVVFAGTTPEHRIGRYAERGFDHLIFLDAVECGAAPGSVVLLDAREIACRFPQISTHNISLGVLAKYIESSGTTRAWLLGAQPESVKPCAGLSPVMRKTLAAVVDLFGGILRKETPLC